MIVTFYFSKKITLMSIYSNKGENRLNNYV